MSISDGKEAQREDGKRYLEQSHNLLEERNSLGTLGAPTWQATGLECTIACPVFTPFVFPELFVLAVDVDPVGFHKVEGV